MSVPFVFTPRAVCTAERNVHPAHRARFAERLAAAIASQGPNMTHVSVKKHFSIEEG